MENITLIVTTTWFVARRVLQVAVGAAKEKRSKALAIRACVYAAAADMHTIYNGRITIFTSNAAAVCAVYSHL